MSKAGGATATAASAKTAAPSAARGGSGGAGQAAQTRPEVSANDSAPAGSEGGTRGGKREDSAGMDAVQKPKQQMGSPAPNNTAPRGRSADETRKQQKEEPARRQEATQEPQLAAGQKPIYHTAADMVRTDLVRYYRNELQGSEKVAQYGLPGEAFEKNVYRFSAATAMGEKARLDITYAKELARVDPKLFKAVARPETQDRLRSEGKVDALYAVANATPYAAGKQAVQAETVAARATSNVSALAANVASQAAALRESRDNTAQASRARGR